jgi:hypothetical protein
MFWCPKAKALPPSHVNIFFTYGKISDTYPVEVWASVDTGTVLSSAGEHGHRVDVLCIKSFVSASLFICESFAFPLPKHICVRSFCQI